MELITFKYFIVMEFNIQILAKVITVTGNASSSQKENHYCSVKRQNVPSIEICE
jgi:hypothetical protein